MKEKPTREAMLVLLEDGQAGQNWLLNKDITTIGRWQDNDVIIPDRWVSRHHAEIRREGTRYVVYDLDSKNGLFVNGRRLVDPLPLEDGDQIQVAPRYQLTFVDSEATAPLFQGQGSVLLDEGACQVWVRGQALEPPLSSAQFDLLKVLVKEPGRVFTRDELIAAVWTDEDASGVSDEALNSLVRRLRKRLMSVDPNHRFIYAVRGHGFRFQHP
jgi:DNA-binding response OmpR family regulator